MVTLLYLIRMFGTTLLLTPLSAYSVSTLEKGQIPPSTAIVTSFRQMVASLATSILVVVISVGGDSTGGAGLIWNSERGISGSNLSGVEADTEIILSKSIKMYKAKRKV